MVATVVFIVGAIVSVVATMDLVVATRFLSRDRGSCGRGLGFCGRDCRRDRACVVATVDFGGHDRVVNAILVVATMAAMVATVVATVALLSRPCRYGPDRSILVVETPNC